MEDRYIAVSKGSLRFLNDGGEMGQRIRAFFGRPPRMGFGPCGSSVTTFSRMRTNNAKPGLAS
jgi:hypothetical protein